MFCKGNGIVEIFVQHLILRRLQPLDVPFYGPHKATFAGRVTIGLGEITHTTWPGFSTMPIFLWPQLQYGSLASELREFITWIQTYIQKRIL
jgi:hypothetical protein